MTTSIEHLARAKTAVDDLNRLVRQERYSGLEKARLYDVIRQESKFAEVAALIKIGEQLGDLVELVHLHTAGGLTEDEVTALVRHGDLS